MKLQKSTENIIANCNYEIKYRCPVKFEQLVPIAGKIENPTEDTINYCHRCQELVYLCKTDQEIEYHVKKGHCIATQQEILSKGRLGFVGIVDYVFASEEDINNHRLFVKELKKVTEKHRQDGFEGPLDFLIRKGDFWESIDFRADKCDSTMTVAWSIRFPEFAELNHNLNIWQNQFYLSELSSETCNNLLTEQIAKRRHIEAKLTQLRIDLRSGNEEKILSWLNDPEFNLSAYQLAWWLKINGQEKLKKTFIQLAINHWEVNFLKFDKAYKRGIITKTEMLGKIAETLGEGDCFLWKLHGNYLVSPQEFLKLVSPETKRFLETSDWENMVVDRYDLLYQEASKIL